MPPLGILDGALDERGGNRGDAFGDDLWRRQVGPAERDAHAHRGARSEPALDLDIASVQADELLDERQPDADAVVRARRRPPDAPESLEQTRKLLLGNSDPRVRDGQLRHAVDALQADCDLA